MRNTFLKAVFLLLTAAVLLSLISCGASDGEWLSFFGGGISHSEVSSDVDNAAEASGSHADHAHVPATLPAVEPTCHSEGKTEGVYCIICGKVLTAQERIPMLEHRLGTIPGIPATCRSEGKTEGYGCLDCDYRTKPQETIPMLEHKLIPILAVEPTCNKDGLSAGEKCTECGYTTVAQEVIPADPSRHSYAYTTEKNPSGRKDGHTAGIYCSSCGDVILKEEVLPAYGSESHKSYEGGYGYFFLGEIEQAKALKALYDSIDECAIRFHNDTGRDAEMGVVAVINYGSLGITASQAVTVWSIYRGDHPLYYWLANEVGYSDSQMILYAYEDYCLGSVRKEINDAIYSGIIEMTEDIPLDADEYEAASALHREIILGMEYAYMQDGEPEEAAWAHGVAGYFTHGAGVCETYAKVFQLALNYLDIENVYVTGDAGGVKHAWNLVLLDDGEWYWFDLTWDDAPSTSQGYRDSYLAVTDSTSVGGRTFAESHIYMPSVEFGAEFVLTLPSRAEKAYIPKQ